MTTSGNDVFVTEISFADAVQSLLFDLETNNLVNLNNFLIIANLLDELALHALRILDVPVREMG